MTDYSKLKALAEAVRDLEDIPVRQDELEEAKDALWLHMHCHTILALLAEIERLSPPAGQVSYQQQMEAWKSASSQDLRARGELMIQVDELKVENEALRKDALRYRWLRDKQTFIWLIQDWFPSDAAFTDVDGEISAAMAKEAPHG